ncbi:MAG: homoserine kinase [Chloroflexi bacterium]|nr:homoserine kinase [Chloroflexota bacterium]MCI0649091.1 homoserine kinase [Chloroflexota bacterium]MCI0727007.1 homoserine kinase [Chloroflexota bacterium]
MVRQVTVTVPATTANLGPGFDCLGLALGLYNRVTFVETAGGLEVVIRGEGAEPLPTDETNLVVRAAGRLFQVVGRRPAGLRVVQENDIPVGSGLGSSAAAALGGLLAANALVNAGLEREALLALATEIEGHPDNVAPALYGGLALVIQDEGRLLVESIPVPEMEVAIVLPAFELPTAEARAALPKQVPLADAVFNAGRVGLLVRALAAGDYGRLGMATQDRLHQPYRLPLVPGLAQAFAAARAAGAAAVALSGAGPSLVAFAPAGHQAIGEAAMAAFASAGLESRSWILPVDGVGCRVE